MHLHFLDRYHSRDSIIHRLDGRVKLLLALGMIFSAAFVPAGAWPVYILLWVFLAIGELLSGLGLWFFIKRAFLAVPFVLAALPIIFTGGGPDLSLSISRHIILISQPGLVRFISIALKSWLSIQAAIWLAATTPFPDVLLAMRALRFPRLLVAIISFMWRYLFVLVDEAYRLNRARLSRSGVPEFGTGRPGGTIGWRARVAGGMVGNLFLRSFDRGDRIYMAMVSRGYDGEIRSLPHPPLAVDDWIVLIVSGAFLALLVVSSYFLWR